MFYWVGYLTIPMPNAPIKAKIEAAAGPVINVSEQNRNGLICRTKVVTTEKQVSQSNPISS